MQCSDSSPVSALQFHRELTPPALDGIHCKDVDGSSTKTSYSQGEKATSKLILFLLGKAHRISFICKLEVKL